MFIETSDGHREIERERERGRERERENMRVYDSLSSWASQREVIRYRSCVYNLLKKLFSAVSAIVDRQSELYIEK
jgi:hypothetical protein